MYTVVPPTLTRALHKFAFAPTAVTSYALGSAPIRAAGATQLPEDAAPSSSQGGGGSGDTEELRQQLELMGTDILQARRSLGRKTPSAAVALFSCPSTCCCHVAAWSRAHTLPHPFTAQGHAAAA